MAARERHGARWTADEIVELIRRIRTSDRPNRLEIARSMGRTKGALAAVADRLLDRDSRPAARSASWRVLCAQVKSTDPAHDPDWWARYCASGQSAESRVQDLQDTETEEAWASFDALSASAAPHTRDHPLDPSDLGPLVADAIAELADERQRSILSRRLGLEDGTATLAALGKEWGLTPQGVKYLEDKALEKLEHRAFTTGSAAHYLSMYVSLLADSEAMLTSRLIDVAEPLFDCDPVRLVKAVARMAGKTPEQAEYFEDLARQELALRAEQLRAQDRAQVLQARVDRIIDKWIQGAVWPDCPTTTSMEAASRPRRRTPPTANTVGHSGSFWSEKLGETVYFDSHVEEIALGFAERSTRVRSYREQPFKLRYTDEHGPRIYIPDVLVTLTDGRHLLVEIKPLWQMAVTENRIKSAVGERFAHEQGWGWVSVDKTGATPRCLLARQVDTHTRDTLRRALARGSVSWADVRRLRREAPIATLDIPAYAMQENISLSLTPYRLG